MGVKLYRVTLVVERSVLSPEVMYSEEALFFSSALAWSRLDATKERYQTEEGWETDRNLDVKHYLATITYEGEHEGRPVRITMQELMTEDDPS